MRKIEVLKESVISVSEINEINKIWDLLVKSVNNDINNNEIKYNGLKDSVLLYRYGLFVLVF